LERESLADAKVSAETDDIRFLSETKLFVQREKWKPAFKCGRDRSKIWKREV